MTGADPCKHHGSVSDSDSFSARAEDIFERLRTGGTESPDVATDPVINFAGGGIAPVANPGLFFTAGINGCSVFAIGAAATASSDPRTGCPRLGDAIRRPAHRGGTLH